MIQPVYSDFGEMQVDGVHVWSTVIMKTLIFLSCVCCFVPVQPADTERYAYCESCLMAAQEIEKAMTEAPAERRQAVAEKLIGGGVCENLSSYKNDRVSQDKLTSSCMRLLESHYDQFHAALVNKELKHLEVVMCYEQSTACVGVKRQSFEDSKKKSFTDSDIEALLQDNKDNVRITQPTRSGSPVDSRDEL